MLARNSFGLVRRPMTGFGADSRTVNSVFGLKSSTSAAAATVKGFGTDTLQRGIGGLRSFVSSSSSSSRSSNDAPAGLGNWDNSCYQNSVIQGLASLRSFPGFLQRVATGTEEQGSMNGALLQMVEQLNDGTNKGKHLWLPAELKTMSTWQQQDAQEYFSKILDKIDKEAIKVAKAEADTPKHLSLADVSSEVPTENQVRDGILDKTEQLRNPLEGLLAQRVTCKSCAHSDGISLIPFNCLTVPLRSATNLQDIRDSLDEYCQLEEIEGVQCPKCTLLSFRQKLEDVVNNANTNDTLKSHFETRLEAVRRALRDDDFTDEAITKKCQIPKKQWVESTKTKQAVIARAPQGLVLHINRSMFNEYTGAQIKNPAPVQFPGQFGLGPWMLGKVEPTLTDKEMKERWSMDPTESMLPPPPTMDEEESEAASLASDQKYELRAVVTHQGRHENGHYIAWRRHGAGTTTNNTTTTDEKHPGETWWRLSDEDVHPVEEDFVLNQGGVFMLFYEMMPDIPRIQTKTETDIHIATLDTASITPPMSVADASAIPLPTISDDELDALLAEDEYVLAQPPASWSPPSSPVPAPPLPHPRQVPTPPESIAESEQDGSQQEEEEEDDDDAKQQEQEQEPVKAIRMRTSSLLGDDRHKGSSESLRIGARMVSAS